MRTNKFVGLKWELSACRGTFYDDDDVLRAIYDAHGDSPQVAAPELHAPFGTVFRPLDAELDPSGKAIPNKMCTMLVADDGDEHHAWICGDPRILAKMPREKPGERLEHGYGASFRRYHADGTITDWVSTTNEPDGQGIFWQIGPAGIVFESPFGSLRFDATGFHVRDRSGARIDAGSAGLPAPFSALGSYAGISAGIVSVEGSATSLGTDGGAANELGVLALIAYLVQVSATLQALGIPTPIPPPSLLAMANIGKTV